jgi:Flp pilus assembly protein TadD
MLVTLPFVFLLLDVWPLGRLGGAESNLALWRKLVVEKLPFFALSAAFCVVAYLAQKGGGAVGDNYPLSVRAANAAIVYVLYLWKTVWPAGLAIFYPHPGKNISWPAAAGALLVLATVTGLAWTQRRGRPYLLVGWLWYLGTLVPVIGLVQIGMQRMADRYTYFPLVGVFAAVAWLAASKWPARRWQQAAAAGLAVCMIAGLGAAARRQAGVWHDSITLFTHALNVTSDNAIAHTQMGVELRYFGRREEAYRHFQEAIRINSNDALSHFNLGLELQARGQAQAAFEHFQQAVRLDSKLAEAHDGLAGMLHELGRNDEALAHYDQALRLNPFSASIHNNFAIVLQNLGRLDEANDEFRKAIRCDPYSAPIRNNLGMLLHRQGKLDEALVEYRKALEIDPNYAAADSNLASALHARGDNDAPAGSQ